MPGNVRTFKLSNGSYADVPEESIQPWMQRMEQRGIGFEDAQVTADMQVGEPEVIKSPPAQEWGRDQEMGFMDRFVNGVKGYGQDFARAGEGLVRGLNQSLYQGGADEFAAAARAARGEDFGTALQGEQAARDRAWEETPITYGAGRALGYVPGMLMGGPVGQGVKEIAKRIGTNVGMSAVNGFLGNDGDVGERTAAAAQDAAIAVPFSAAGEAMSAMGPAIDKAGIAMRRANAGGDAGELNAIRRNSGLEHMQSGIDEDFADLGLASSWKPQSAYGVAKKLGAPEQNGQPATGIIGAGGRQMGAAIDNAGADGARGDWDSVRQSMDNSVRASMRGNPEPTVSQRGFAGEMSRIQNEELPRHLPINYADDFALPEPSPAVKQWSGPDMPGGPVDPRTPPDLKVMGTPPREYDYIPPLAEMGTPPRAQTDFLEPQPGYNPNLATPRELQTKKMAFEAEGYPREGAVTLNSDAPRADAYQASAGAVRGELHDTMDRSGFGPSFHQGRETVEKATPLADMAGKRAAQNKAGMSMFNPVNAGLMFAGAAPGAIMGDPGTALMGAAVGYGVNALGRNYGQDIAGMGARALGQGMQGMGAGMQRVGQSGALGGATSSMASAQAPSPETAPGGGVPAGQIASNGLPGDTRGYMTPDVARQMLQQNPMAFGPYTQQFHAALQDPDQSALVRLLDRLETTDDNWSNTYLKQLQQATAQQGGSF